MPALSAGIRKLYSNRPYGQPVYAATFIRQRRIVLDQELERHPRELARILVHELYHFVWVRLGNEVRASYRALLLREWKARARGELGWSAEMRKAGLARGRLSAVARRQKWHDYSCESFCDTAAWLYAGLRRHPEFTLAARHRKKRADWFHATFEDGRIPI